ncbi:MAG: hypothetical protein IIC32_03480 [Chloroflexi bacterium]|nr:hypothetical protein [Chloroflexota bacterium]
MRLPRVFDRRRRRYEKLVTEHLDGVLDAAGEARLQQLLDSDEALAVEARELDAVTALLRAEPLVEPPRSFALPYAPARVPAPPHRGPLRWMQAATATAALVLVTLIGVDLVVTPAAVSEAPESSTATAEQAPAASQAAPPPDAPAIDSAFADGAGQDKVQPFPLTRSLAPEPEPAPAAGRSALDWAQLGFALATAALALGVALVSWRAARSRA